jgi:hypothetical protein
LCSVCNHGKGNWDTTDWRPNWIGLKLIGYWVNLRSIQGFLWEKYKKRWLSLEI